MVLPAYAWIVGNIDVGVVQVKRAIQLRNIVTSLGPAYIKLGQALSIRPDILSPAAMVELQKLCDKVPSYDNDIAMQVLCDELGAPWYEVYLLPAIFDTSACMSNHCYKPLLIALTSPAWNCCTSTT